MGLQFDGTISIGTLVEVTTFVGAWVATVTKFNNRLGNVETNQKEQSAKLDSLTQIQNLQARFDERMSSMRRDLEELKRGKGFIKQELEREYP